MKDKKLRKVTKVRRKLPRVSTNVKAGPTRRVETFGDPVGNYNFKVEIEGVDAGH